ncbi:MAG: nitrilase-related carbon-nitrogen hydrolase [Candidatus Gracilibacteria bacterium]|nr:nitrilase-related carbon-nitrogen hydrolase [Candidatus Gracilibacteria bacterium]MDQ7023350.1 nitrilase-related carbon-nitrogen hydrolase [Candidatus Gracilibacteria bacterium]
MKICLINFEAAWKDKEKNIEKKEELIKRALEMKPETNLIIFPELSLTGYVLDKDNIKLAETEFGESIEKVKNLAKKYEVAIMFGFIEKKGNDKPYNSTIVIDKNGETLAKYRKIHLFTQSVEPDLFSAGEKLETFEFEGVKCGLSICFDIRYPRLYETYKYEGVECVFTPYAWVDGRNKPDIFASLSKGRSSENQFFMVGVDNIGKDINNSYIGNAIVSNPYSEDIKETFEEIFHFANIDTTEIKSIENIIPLEDGFKEDYII